MSVEAWVGIIIAVMGGLGGFITAIITALNSISKTKAEALETQFLAMVQSLTSLQATVKTLQEENERLRECVDELEREQEQLKIENRALQERVDELEKENENLRKKVPKRTTKL